MIDPTTSAVAAGSPNLLTNSWPFAVPAPSGEADGRPCAVCISDIEASMHFHRNPAILAIWTGCHDRTAAVAALIHTTTVCLRTTL